jgi:zeaxanthin glucosyltransferase
MKIRFITPAVPGHFNPMSAVARELQSRNHDVVMVSVPALEPRARAADLPFVASAEKEVPIDKSAEIVKTLSRLRGEEGLQFTVNHDCRESGIKVEHVTENTLFDRRRCDTAIHTCPK